MTLNELEAIRERLAEQRVWFGEHQPALLVDGEALLAEVDRLRSVREETEHAMHMRIRASYDTTIADAWRQANQKLADTVSDRNDEIAELRAELEAMKAERAALGEALDSSTMALGPAWVGRAVIAGATQTESLARGIRLRVNTLESELSRLRKALEALHGCVAWSDSMRQWHLLGSERVRPVLVRVRAALSGGES